jgi:hypothetical protein
MLLAPRDDNQERRLGSGFVCQQSMDMIKKNPWPESGSKLYRSSYRRLSAKLVPIFADRGCRVVSATDPYGRITGCISRGAVKCFAFHQRLFHSFLHSFFYHTDIDTKCRYQLLRYCAYLKLSYRFKTIKYWIHSTNRKVAGSIPDEVNF